MKKWLSSITLLFSLFIVGIVISANTDHIPDFLKPIYDFPGGDKVGHFILFGILSFLVNKSALNLLPNQNTSRLCLTVSLFLSILIGMEEWSQAWLPSRTMSLADLLASYTGVIVFALLAYRSKE